MRWEPPTDEQAIPAFTQQAFHADLLVLGQRDPADDDASTVPRDFVEAVIVGSGTPALVVPFGGRSPERLGTVLVAWQPSRESARALSAALPLLQQAEEVHLVTWMDDADAARECQQAVVDHLRLHGIDDVDRHRSRVPDDVGGTLLAAAAGVGADLLVMGCYGRSPARELMLGGATRTVLQQMHLPVLMGR
jgi:nucleotide-binding universal stress UspA family protein